MQVRIAMLNEALECMPNLSLLSNEDRTPQLCKTIIKHPCFQFDSNSHTYNAKIKHQQVKCPVLQVDLLSKY